MLRFSDMCNINTNTSVIMGVNVRFRDMCNIDSTFRNIVLKPMRKLKPDVQITHVSCAVIRNACRLK